MNRQEYQQSIIKSLSWLSAEVSASNKLNLTDINIYAENFYRDLLNLAFNYRLKNINILDSNATAIDLGDDINKIAIQVTSTSELAKTKHTVKKFIEKKLYTKYNRLIILNIAHKKNHTIKSIGDDSFTLHTKNDIWDTGTLSVKINDLDLEKIQSINDFLNKQLHITPTEKLPRNVDTILQLIELISNEEHPAVGEGFLEEPFPDEKINKRFSEHAAFLKQEFLILYQEYGAVLDAVEKDSDISQTKLRRVTQHLRLFSDRVITECGGDPKVALEKIIDTFVGLLNKNGFDADTGAAQFYVIKHLIKCNVFPNKEIINVESIQ
ncbi:SMEK domain-containing protein [Aeromonas veronii]|uniref:SMEK domain-containing protein n=1 Tax=Aeromonas TaxID=642 RepID=UPI0011178730|nr:SMEK domain-containing protein [Aeromonas veronii]MCF5880201.1 SMEK domain-containing protein [Aeromonas veronii]